MKKIITTVSLTAMGVSGLHAAYAPDLSPLSSTKLWSISASVRGFYDDNYLTAPSHAAPGFPQVHDTYGFEVIPSFDLNLPLDQTFISLGYEYRLTYYDDRRSDNLDMTHIAKFRLDHAFSPSTKLELKDEFVVAQEPSIVEPDGAMSTLYRTDSDVMRNTASLAFTGAVTSELSYQLRYSNNWYDYDQSGIGSRSAILDRIQHRAALDLRYQVLPATVAILGYQVGILDYTSKDALTPSLPVSHPANDPSIRNTLTHFIYAGADQTFGPQLMGSVRAGAEITDFTDLPFDESESQVRPYADASVTFTYRPGSYLQIGGRHTRNVTDVAYLGALSPTLDQTSTIGYANIKHKLTESFSANLLGQLQFSEFNGGSVDGNADVSYIFGANLAYQLSPHFALEAGYNFYRLDSDIVYAHLGDKDYKRSFSRNRVYIGIRGTI